MDYVVENLRLKPFPFEGETIPVGGTAPLDGLVREWGGNVVQLHLQAGRLRLQGVRGYMNNEMHAKDAAYYVGLVAGTSVPPTIGLIPEIPEVVPEVVEVDEFVEVEVNDEIELIDPSKFGNAEVLDWVTANGQAQAILDLEITGKSRPRLIRALEELL